MRSAREMETGSMVLPVLVKKVRIWVVASKLSAEGIGRVMLAGASILDVGFRKAVEVDVMVF